MKTFKFRFCYEISADANLGIDDVDISQVKCISASEYDSETEGGCE